MNQARYGCGLATLKGIVYALGGYHPALGALSSVEVFDEVFDRWTPVVLLQSTLFSIGRPPAFTATELDFHSRVLLLCRSMYRTLTAASALPAARFGFRTAVASGNLFVLGGYDHRSQPTATVWRFAQPVASSAEHPIATKARCVCTATAWHMLTVAESFANF